MLSGQKQLPLCILHVINHYYPQINKHIVRVNKVYCFVAGVGESDASKTSSEVRHSAASIAGDKGRGMPNSDS